jgi:hypothetical protein
MKAHSQYIIFSLATVGTSMKPMPVKIDDFFLSKRFIERREGSH